MHGIARVRALSLHAMIHPHGAGKGGGGSHQQETVVFALTQVKFFYALPHSLRSGSRNRNDLVSLLGPSLLERCESRGVRIGVGDRPARRVASLLRLPRCWELRFQSARHTGRANQGKAEARARKEEPRIHGEVGWRGGTGKALLLHGFGNHFAKAHDSLRGDHQLFFLLSLDSRRLPTNAAGLRACRGFADTRRILCRTSVAAEFSSVISTCD